ncbi:MAG: phosphocholine cytidylyltransferase family protein [Candidatus Marinimicrobia bacterium]|nr:phosphocholine cytidylyltransferase family protein [Candidatus Neomarinimicrobiota bacterium]
MTKIAKTIKIESSHEEWLKAKHLNFSAWVRRKLDEEIRQSESGTGRKPLKAVILAAGKDEGLSPLTDDIPKTLLDIKGKTILERQLEILRHAGIKHIAVVRGYKKHQINYPGLQYFDNDAFEDTGSLVSLLLAREYLDTDTIILYGDILFDTETLDRLIESRGDAILVVDRGWKKRYQDSKEGHDLQPELTSLVEGAEDTRIIGVGSSETAVSSEFIGLAKLSESILPLLEHLYTNIYSKKPETAFHSASSIRMASFLDFIQELIEQQKQVTALEIWRSWIDVDTFEDYRNSWKLIENISKG